MPERRCLLILGGTGDAAALAKACASTLPQLRTVSSLAGRTRSAAPLAGASHVGGFGGPQGLTNFIQQTPIDLVVDATHPFAAQISQHAALACTALGIPRLQLLRRPWSAERGDRWIGANDMTEAAQHLRKNFIADRARVFLSTGRGQLTAFSHLRNTWFLIRTVDPLLSPAPLARCTALVGRGPFSIDEECALLEKHQINVLVSKNSGGNATYAKILAARQLSLPVIMLQRPAVLAGPAVYDVDGAIAWLRAHL